jgi:hypothetical protein
MMSGTSIGASKNRRCGKCGQFHRAVQPCGRPGPKSPTIEELIVRFWSLIDRKGPDDCWPWLGSINPETGYGQFDGFRGRGLPRAVHVAVWILTNGPKPNDDLCICHTCDVKICCNPRHLWLGTNDQNIADKIAKGRQMKHERHWNARLTADNVAEVRSTNEPPELLARKFGVSRRHIIRIQRGEKW